MDAVSLQKRSDNGLDLHTKNFLGVVKSRKMEDLKCSIHEGAHVATVCQMGNIAYKTGKKIYWDAAKKNLLMPTPINFSQPNIIMAIPCRGFSFLWARQQQSFSFRCVALFSVRINLQR